MKGIYKLYIYTVCRHDTEKLSNKNVILTLLVYGTIIQYSTKVIIVLRI